MDAAFIFKNFCKSYMSYFIILSLDTTQKQDHNYLKSQCFTDTKVNMKTNTKLALTVTSLRLSTLSPSPTSQLSVGPGDRQAEDHLHQPHWRLHVPGPVHGHEHLHLRSLRLPGQAVGPEGRDLQADLLGTHQRHQRHRCEHRRLATTANDKIVFVESSDEPEVTNIWLQWLLVKSR